MRGGKDAVGKSTEENFIQEAAVMFIFPTREDPLPDVPQQAQTTLFVTSRIG